MAAPGKSQPLRVGIIGVGIGQAHIKGYAKVPNAQVVALCDLDEARARSVAQEHGLTEASIWKDHRAMLDEARLDAVSVCLPNSLHRPVAVDSLNAGMHVLCEKPLALNAKEAQKIVDAAARNNLKCMVAQVLRFRDQSRYLKSVINSGQLGDIYYCHTGWLRKRGIPGFGGWFTTKEMSGGGPLIDIGVHLLDLAWWLCGCPQPVSASGVTYAKFGPKGKGRGSWGAANAGGSFDVEDLAVGLIRFANGLTINLEVSWALNNDRDHQWCQIFGSEGGCDWNDHPGLHLEVNGANTNSKVEIAQNDPWQGEMQHFVDCVRGNKKPDPDAAQGLTMMKMLDAIYKSAETGRDVPIR